MSRQLNLRVTDDFADRLEKISRRLGRPMSSVLETLGNPALEAAEADLQFETEALAAWEDYQLTGTHVTSEAIDALFADSLRKATSEAEKRRK